LRTTLHGPAAIRAGARSRDDAYSETREDAYEGSPQMPFIPWPFSLSQRLPQPCPE
jgi:hypothetical protein